MDSDADLLYSGLWSVQYMVGFNPQLRLNPVSHSLGAQHENSPVLEQGFQRS